MIEVTPVNDSVVCFSHPHMDVRATEGSGETSLFSQESGFWGVEAGENWHLCRGNSIIASIAGYQLQWAGAGDFIVSHDRARSVVRYGDVIAGDAPPQAPDGGFFLRPPPGAHYSRQDEQSSGKHFQMVAWRNDDTKERWVRLFDAMGVKYAWKFDHRIHGGDALRDSWHELYQGSQWLVVNLSSYGKDKRLPHYLLRLDGNNWHPLEFDTQFPRLSHLTVDGDTIVGTRWDPDPAVFFFDIEDGIARFQSRFDANMGHGCLRNGHLAYSVWSDEHQRDVAVMRYSGGLQGVVRAIPSQGSRTRARPSIRHDGNQVVWHETLSGRQVVMSWLDKEPEPKETALDIAREIRDKVERLIATLDTQ